MIRINDTMVTKLLAGDCENISGVMVEGGELKVSGEFEESFDIRLSDPHLDIREIFIEANIDEDKDSIVSMSHISLKKFSVTKLHYGSTEKRFRVNITNISTLNSVSLYNINVPIVFNVENADIGKFSLEQMILDYIKMDNFNVSSIILEHITGVGTERRIELLGVRTVLNKGDRTTKIEFKDLKNISAIVLKGRKTHGRNITPAFETLNIIDVDAKSITVSGFHIKEFHIECNESPIDKLILTDVEVDTLYITKNAVKTLVIENSRIGKLFINSEEIESISLRNIDIALGNSNSRNDKNILLDLKDAYVELKPYQNEMRIGMFSMDSKLEIDSLQCKGDLIFRPRKNFSEVVLTNLRAHNIRLSRPEDAVDTPYIRRLKIQGDLYSGNTTEILGDMEVENLNIGELVIFNVEVGNLRFVGSNHNSIFEKFLMKKVNIRDNFEIINYDICPKNNSNKGFEASKVYAGGDIVLKTKNKIGLSDTTPAWIRTSIYGLARRNYDANGNPEKADKYFVLEMRSRRENNRKKSRNSDSIWKKITGELAYWGERIFIDTFSEYGTNWKRTFALWFVMWLLGSIIYAVYDLLGLLSSVPVHSILGYMYISISALVTSDPYVEFSSALATWTYALEMGLGIYIWTQLLALFSRQFMRGT
ncbi:hypothetical protein GQS_07790 [Thermococcus sp. 4557]|uniref:hypothetical protein n=1 Tax=Thermococcus sp. (strain CGMCC 1.5172 / 4557) TaxID=1042877 RepID=UPI000219EC9F|nr:hypothetical protein [Thermococcus sp. 4557]AEK73454.1 hypothetical protein GQS_07790 [Thermococcus sp. 4557]